MVVGIGWQHLFPVCRQEPSRQQHTTGLMQTSVIVARACIHWSSSEVNRLCCITAPALCNQQQFSARQLWSPAHVLACDKACRQAPQQAASAEDDPQRFGRCCKQSCKQNLHDEFACFFWDSSSSLLHIYSSSTGIERPCTRSPCTLLLGLADARSRLLMRSIALECSNWQVSTCSASAYMAVQERAKKAGPAAYAKFLEKREKLQQKRYMGKLTRVVK